MRYTSWRDKSALAVAALVLSTAAFGQTYPSRSITIIVPFGPSSLPDALARMVASAVSPEIGQQVVVDNRPGGNTVIGVGLAAKAAQDGYTLLLTGTSVYAITPLAVPKLPYDLVKDFAPITEATRAVFFLVASPALGVDSVQGLVALARSQPGKVNYASPGIGTTHHLAMEHLKMLAKIDLVHVPYKGVIPTMELLSNEVSVMFSTLPALLAHVKAGKLRALAAASSQRSQALPNVPTVDESGFPGFNVRSSLGFAVPTGAPRPIIERLNAIIVAALRSPPLQEKMANFGQDIIAGTPNQFAERIRSDQEFYSTLLRQIHVKLN